VVMKLTSFMESRCPLHQVFSEQITQGLLLLDIWHMHLMTRFRFIHREGSPHKYAVAWTTMREPELDATAGGHFFICNYGVKVEAAADSVVVWNPKSWHGTSLQRREPSNPGIFQAGLAIVTPTGINNLWQEVLDEKISLEEARKKVLDLETEELDI
jgi:hypothetical protein